MKWQRNGSGSWVVKTARSKMVSGLLSLPTETEWVEFKENRAEADDIGEYISALSPAGKFNRR
jgi:hypothetical protein